MPKPTFRPPYTLVSCFFSTVFYFIFFFFVCLPVCWISPIVIGQRRHIWPAYLHDRCLEGERSPLVPCALHPVSVLRTCRVGPTFVPQWTLCDSTPYPLSLTVASLFSYVSCGCCTLSMNRAHVPLDSTRTLAREARKSLSLFLFPVYCYDS